MQDIKGSSRIAGNLEHPIGTGSAGGFPMLIHIVSFKYKADVSEEAREDHRSRLRALGKVAGVEELKVGADVVRSPRSYDTGLLVVFLDRAGLDAYQQDPQHVPVAQLGVSLSEHIVAVDFESEVP